MTTCPECASWAAKWERQRTKTRTLRQAATALFDLLDQIDTSDDVAKTSDAAFRKMAMSLVKHRFAWATTDGFNLTFKEPYFYHQDPRLCNCRCHDDDGEPCNCGCCPLCPR